ncbi:dienelactone hydrolase [Paenibacillus turicensis]|uniref:Dienelactone hydrolase n=1 Tax=Paenibacillus turicensis TaxID=160487 RepID=A0ABS4FLX4_9BACL|nr:dienelactone hydrolase family protein [Paenibacillus turicensis]MBP1903574.1 dienelactone hydrolase [Paenibacillus turicensis]
MKTYIRNQKQAVILLHEIYGMNFFMEEQGQRWLEAGYDVYCPNLLHRTPFAYEESELAYSFFVNQVGFAVYLDIIQLLKSLKEKYADVFIVGFSVGATVAWRCSENELCSGVIACYGSRIRDYIHLTPACPTLLLFAKEDSFDVKSTIKQLQHKEQVDVYDFDAKHGFLDPYNHQYDEEQTEKVQNKIAQFMSQFTHL